MAIDTTTFVPPSKPPAVVEKKLPGYAGEAISVTSGQWHYVLTGNSLLPPQVLRGILAAATDPRLAVQAVSDAYRKAGYFLVAVTAQVETPADAEQASSSAVRTVTIRVVEGRISQLDAPPAEQPYFAGLQHNPTLTESDVTRAAVQASDFAARNGERLQVGFAPAEQPGGSALRVEATPAPDFKPVNGTLLLGNYGSRYTSSYVAGANVAAHPGGGVELTANYLAGLPNWSRDSRGSQYHLFGVGASVVTPYGTYGINAQKTKYQLGRISYPLNTAGEVQTVGLSGSQLLFANARTQLSLVEGFNHVLNRSTVFGGAYTLTDQRYDYASLGLKYTQGYSLAGLGGALIASYTYNRGTKARSGTFLLSAAPTAPNPLFHYTTLNLSLQQQLPHGYLAQLTLNGQRALDTLPQQQQWVIGGLGNLSAYNSGLAVGDTGYALRASVQAPTRQFGPFSLTPNVFVEHAAAHYQFVPSAWQRATDIGVGLNLSTRFGTTLTALYAAPIKRQNIPAATAQGLRATVFVILQQSF
ncbi:MAG: ShlB/FhaC/HecB family hemolysin secretion/activation protein [Halothiobacillaceae bacterium]